MVIALVGTSNNGTTNQRYLQLNRGAGGTPGLIAAPGALSVGHFYVPVFAYGSVGGGTTFTTPTGFTRHTGLGTNAHRSMTAFGIAVTSGTQLTQAASITSTSGSTTSSRAAVVGVALSGVDLSAPVVGETSWAYTMTSTSSQTFPTAVSGADAMLWFVYATGATTTTHPVMTSVGGTKLHQITSFNGDPTSYSESTGISTTAQSSTVLGVFLGGTGVTFAYNTANTAVIGIGLKAAAIAPATRSVLISDGSSLSEYGVYISNGTTLDETQHIAVMPPALTVSEFHANIMANTYPRMAHRNIGGTYPECTLNGAFWAAIKHGSNLLEFSVHKSLDNVWVGSHDATVDRATNGTGAISAMNWSVLSDLTVDVGTTQTSPPAKMSRLDDYLVWFKDYVMFIDNKPGTSYADFLNLCLTVPNATEHVIIKIDGSAPASRIQQAQAAGFKTFVYWYDTSNWSTIPDKMQYTNYAGLNVEADQSYWDDLRDIADAQTLIDGLDRPFWAHIMTTEVNITTAISKGAKFFQTTNAALFPQYDW